MIYSTVLYIIYVDVNITVSATIPAGEGIWGARDEAESGLGSVEDRSTSVMVPLS